MNWKKASIAAVITAILSYGVWELFKDFINIKNHEASYVGKINSLTGEGFPDRTINSTLNLSEIESKITFVHFWASWCSPCIDEFPSLVKLAKDFPENLSIVAISLDENKNEFDAFLQSLEIKPMNNFLIIRDDNYEYADKVGTEKLPETFILDKNKKLIRKVPTAENWDSPNVRDFLKYLISK
ncbi:MAG: TlpA disulfide reductase family protein [Bdellovibrionota bacterium]